MSDDDDGLRVLATVAPGARWPTGARIGVVLRNEGAAPLKVARRLAVGHREADGRELFADVYPRGSDDIVGRATTLYDRDPPAAEDYVALQPGDEIGTSFDLMDWYGLPGPGAYDVEVFYEGDGRRAPAVEGAARGIHGSGRIALDLPAEPPA